MLLISLSIDRGVCSCKHSTNPLGLFQLYPSYLDVFHLSTTRNRACCVHNMSVLTWRSLADDVLYKGLTIGAAFIRGRCLLEEIQYSNQ